MALRNGENLWLLGLCALAIGSMVVGIFVEEWPLVAGVVPLVLGISALSGRSMLTLVVVVLISTIIQTQSVMQGSEWENRRWLGFFIVVLVALICIWQVSTRSGLGFARTRGESMLIDLRDRLAAQGQLPTLPSDWHAEAVIRSAGGASFAGDFIVAAKTHSGHRLEIVLVDVSGKGLAAGTRALLLSGAFGGLLGSLEPKEFLPAANDYLIRQGWGEGFATAVHLLVDLQTGGYEVRTAGHPPAVQFHAGSGRWSVNWTDGPILGLVEHSDYSPYMGRLLPGDALMLYTDGLVETPRRDITFGIDKLLGEAERLVQRGLIQGADRLVRMVGTENDDRALLMLHRR